MKNDGNYILMPAGWYPHNDDPFNGDFVQRHAISIAQYHKVIVVFAVKSSLVKAVKIEINQKCNGNLIEYICYYPPRKSFDRLFSLITYRSVFKKIFKQITQRHGMPKLVHVNIAWKAGLWALYLKQQFGLKYVITENWTGYYNEDPGNIRTKSVVIQHFIKKIFREADLFIPVTKDLGERCNHLFRNIKYEVVENAVDTRLFYYTAGEITGRKRLVHVSTMNYQKHADGLIAAVDRLAAQRNDLELLLIGPFSNEMKQCLAAHPNAAAITTTTGNIPYKEVAAHVRNAQLMVLFSRYENLPCVLLEALCCGVPVVATDVGGIREVISNENGRIIASGDVDGLVNILDKMLNKLPEYNNETIAEKASAEFSYAAIGKKYADIYKRL